MDFKSFLSSYENGYVQFCAENNLELNNESLSLYEAGFFSKFAPLMAAGALLGAPQDAEAQGFKSAGGGVVPGVTARQQGMGVTPKMQFSPITSAVSDPLKTLEKYNKQNMHVRDGYLGNLRVVPVGSGQEPTFMVYDSQGKPRGRYVTHEKAIDIFKQAQNAGWTYTGNYSFKSPDGSIEVNVGNVRPSTFN